MSDAGRKDFSTKASEAMTPDSQKSTFEKAKETVTGGADKAARDVQGDSSKSTGQSLSDNVGREKDSHGESTLDQVKGAVGMDKH